MLIHENESGFHVMRGYFEIGCWTDLKSAKIARRAAELMAKRGADHIRIKAAAERAAGPCLPTIGQTPEERRVA